MDGLFATYFEVGIWHVLDIKAYDHILFIIALCVPYSSKSWKKLFLLATAFTVGHSLTLGLAIFDVIHFSQSLVEKFIPVTIILTCIYNIYQCLQHTDETSSSKLNLNYIIALGFGLIHGMGFSSFFRSALMPGEENELWQQLLAFNLGIEVSQLIIILGFVVLAGVVLNVIGVKWKYWVVGISVFCGLVAMKLLLTI